MKKNTILIKISSMFLILSIIISTYFLFSAYKYNSYINSFFEYFNNKEYEKADNYLASNENFNLYKSLFLEKDLYKFSNDTINKLNINLQNNTITDLDAVITLYELDKYVNNDSIKQLKNNIPLITLSKENYNKALPLLDDNLAASYTLAIDYLDKVSPYSDEYNSAIDLKSQTLNNLKTLVIEKSDYYAKNENYSKAISVLDEYNTYLADNKDFIEKRESYFTLKNTKLASDSKSDDTTKSNSFKDDDKTTAASTFLANISSNNMNSMGISSPTKYLIYVNLSEQKTYVYSGSSNKWSLEKSMSCSTGIKNYETPKGVFDVTDRGDWFFSDKYNDGAKYWVQFKGNYLFHSLPFKEDKQTVTDYTLGKAASHGCIRLSIPDAKWLYDNISNKTKVIIN